MDSANREPPHGGNNPWPDIRFFILAVVFYILATLLWVTTWRAVEWPAVRERIRERMRTHLSRDVVDSPRASTTTTEDSLTSGDVAKEEGENNPD